jgi:rhamnosyltransferase
MVHKSQGHSLTGKVPRIAVLLASYNGVRWLPDQIRSILDQKGVETQIFVSDDGSHDGTQEWLQLLAEEHQRVCLLSCRNQPSGVGDNFYFLIENAPWQSFDAVALADQDDIWFESKLARHFGLMNETKSVGVSSDVLALWPSGRTSLVKKSDPQTRFDYFFESSGPGCSFLICPSFLTFIKDKVLKGIPKAKEFEFHDWLIYAIARSQNRPWYIDPVPSMYYRQHQNNHIGANIGIIPALKRIRLVANKSYRQKVQDLLSVLRQVQGGDKQAFSQVADLLSQDRFWSRFIRARLAKDFRRSRRDQLALRTFFILGWW